MNRGFENAAKTQPLPVAKNGAFREGINLANKRQHPTDGNPKPASVTSGTTGKLN